MQIQSTTGAVSSTQGLSGTASGAALASPPRTQPSSEQPARVAADPATRQNKPDNPATPPKPSKEDVDKAAEKIQKFVDSVRGDIRFSIDQDSGKTVVKVIDKETSEVLKQFPSEEALELAKALDKFQGLLVKQQA